MTSGRSEAQTRAEIIDTQLARSGWSRNRRNFIAEFLLRVEEPDDAHRGEQFADYVLLRVDARAKLTHFRG